MAFTYFLNFFSKLSSSSEEEALPGYLLEIKARFLQKSGPSSDNFRRFIFFFR